MLNQNKVEQTVLIELHRKAKNLMQIYGYPHPDYLAVMQQIKQIMSD
ncbi:hypothetical protein [Floridanema aerugineum]|uniref:Uncharacterized protein n=1 Tax=Floridaenema aerugineum BLCC-F46 TaxID=3153654 RepID=A0ABV4XBC8_9CYAN